MTFKTEQEAFWAGEFGNSYINRNTAAQYLSKNLSFFSKALKSVNSMNSVIEYGSNIGINLRALKLLFPDQRQFGIEINPIAHKELVSFMGAENTFNGSIFDYKATEQFELSMVKGVLIHINPEMLPAVYESLYKSSKRYILVAEYYNPSPVEVSYRGHKDRLFKRDFCGEMLDKYPDLQLIDYGFVYHRDTVFPQDDITWFLMEKR